MTKEDLIFELKKRCSFWLNNKTISKKHALENLLGILENEESQPSIPSNLEEAADTYIRSVAYAAGHPGWDWTTQDIAEAFKAGAEWMAGQGWIDDGSMPPETKYEEDTMQGHKEWTESEPVLAWDSMYGPCVDVTKNGKWMSEQRGGYTGQICHGIIAWRPIPEYKEKQ